MFAVDIPRKVEFSGVSCPSPRGSVSNEQLWFTVVLEPSLSAADFVPGQGREEALGRRAGASVWVLIPGAEQ